MTDFEPWREWKQGQTLYQRDDKWLNVWAKSRNRKLVKSLMWNKLSRGCTLCLGEVCIVPMKQFPSLHFLSFSPCKNIQYMLFANLLSLMSFCECPCEFLFFPLRLGSQVFLKNYVHYFMDFYCWRWRCSWCWFFSQLDFIVHFLNV